ncbi:uncharacterized protein A4U43_C01F15730 [Asparagus officinalis]|uniref:Peroxidase n=1 Tax=Asparagus officinalis TaxID=4686 RepID=A0A5P1FQG0_ASPOF|nr:peroxidase P7-like [Asparagus officinalis]ONK80264.1 uncharacterized protein A4U43_C01F15730 [Asparagus officinalis]
MAFSSTFFVFSLFSVLALINANGQLLDDKFYKRTCPSLRGMVRSTMARAVKDEKRMGASILRLFFHDCFVNGCDASILLDDTPTFTGEKNAFPNRNSVRGFEVIDTIKSKVEAKCKGTVSCADILALAARDAVVLLGGPSWKVELGRRDSRTASQSAANSQLPPFFVDLPVLISMFAAKGLDARDMTALSGAHTIGLAGCGTFQRRVTNESNIDPQFASLRQSTCRISNSRAPLDDGSEESFDNGFYRNLVARRGLLHSDQELFNGGSQDSLVKKYSENQKEFENDFVAAMIKMGRIDPLTGNEGEIRLNCGVVN